MRLVNLALALALSLAACAGSSGTRPPTYPPAGTTPAPAGSRTDAARGAVLSALAAAGLQGSAPDAPYLPPEGPWFAAASRTVVHVAIPGDPTPRYVVLYAFDSAADATAAANDEAAYLFRGAGAVYVPGDSRTTIRTLGDVAIFFTWSPANADPRDMAVETALGGIGTAVASPR